MRLPGWILFGAIRSRFAPPAGASGGSPTPRSSLALGPRASFARWSAAALGIAGLLPAPPVPALTLPQAQALAAARNPDVRSAAADVEAARGQLRSAGQYPNPTLSLSTGKIRTDRSQRVPGKGLNFFDRNYDNVVSISELVELGGKRGLRRRSAAALVAAARARLDDVARQTRLAVARAFIAALLAVRQSELLRESASLLRREAGLAQVRLAAGDISDADRAQIEVTAARLELDAEAAAAAARAARIQLEALLGESHPEGRVALEGSLDGVAAALAPREPAAPAGERADVSAARLALAKTQSDLALERAYRLPDLTLSLQYEREQPDTPNSLGLGVSLPLPLPGYRDGEVRAARAAVQSARAGVDRAATQAEADLAAARANFAEASLRARRYEAQVVPAAEKVRATVSFAYRAGGATLADLLTAQRAANEVRAAAAQAQADRASAAAALAAARERPAFPFSSR